MTQTLAPKWQLLQQRSARNSPISRRANSMSSLKGSKLISPSAQASSPTRVSVIRGLRGGTPRRRRLPAPICPVAPRRIRPPSIAPKPSGERARDWWVGQLEKHRLLVGVVSFLVTLRPFWWVFRGWIVYFAVGKFFTGWMDFVPTYLHEWLLLLGTIVLSVGSDGGVGCRTAGCVSDWSW